MTEKHDMNSAKENVYIALGALAKKFPEFVKDKMHILKMYFDALDREEPHVRICVQQGLSNLVLAYQSPTAEMAHQLEQLFLGIVENVRT